MIRSYYIHCPVDMNMKPVILVPTYQFQHLLDVVNAKLDTRLTIPPGTNEERFTLLFGLGNTPRPRFLGRCNSSSSHKNLRNAIPRRAVIDDLAKATPLGIDEFRRLLKLTRAERGTQRKSDKNRLKRIKEHKAWGQSIKRVQRYLGLRCKVGAGTSGVPGHFTALNLSEPTAEKPEDSVLFVAIDVEAWERNQNIITEVGIAMLDTTDIQHIPPGEGGREWFKHIRARHVRIKENMWAVNGRWVADSAEWFGFGFVLPFSVSLNLEQELTLFRESEIVNQSRIVPLIREQIDRATFVDPVDGITKPRPVVLVFHEASSDIKYLEIVGYNVGEVKNVLEAVDTRQMHQYLVQSNNSGSLSAVLANLDISHRHLHNAGNDAVYTLQAMIGLAVKKRQQSLEKAAKETKTSG